MNTASMMMQFKMDIKKGILRNVTLLFFSVAMPIGWYLLFTKVFQMDIPADGEQAFQVAILMNMTLYSVLVSSLYSLGMLLLEDRESGVRKYVRLTPVTDLQYYIGKILYQLFINVLMIVAVFVVGRVVNHVEMSLGQWFLCRLWILFASLSMIAIGSLFSLCKNVNTASVLANAVNFPLAILGGLWWPIDNFPLWVQSFCKLLPTYAAANGAKMIGLGELPALRDVVLLLGYFIVFASISVYAIGSQEKNKGVI